MEKFTSEVLNSGAKVLLNAKGFYVSNGEDYVHLTKSDINRLHGIAFPEKRRTGSCSNAPEATDVPDINVGDIPALATVDVYEENVRKVAEEMAANYWNANKSNAALRFDQLSSFIQQGQIENMVTTARIAVRLQWEVYSELLAAALYGRIPDERIESEVLRRAILEGLIPAPEEPNKAEKDNPCIFCGAVPFVWKGTCCASCGKSYRHG